MTRITRFNTGRGINTGRGAKIGRSMGALAGLLLLAAVAGCAPRQDIQGAVLEQERMDQIIPGSVNDQQVRQIMGSPSATSAFSKDGSIWYYISRETETIAFLPPSVLDQKVFAVAFDENRQVVGVRHYGLKDGREIDFSSRITPTKGRDLSILQELFGNLGKFNTSK